MPLSSRAKELARILAEMPEEERARRTISLGEDGHLVIKHRRDPVREKRQRMSNVVIAGIFRRVADVLAPIEREQRCPRCNLTIEQGTPRCHHCHTSLTWYS